MSCDFMETDQVHKTGEVLVPLDDHGIPSFTIKQDAAYDYIRPTAPLLRSLSDHVDLFYFGTLAQRHTVSRETLYVLLEKIPREAINWEYKSEI